MMVCIEHRGRAPIRLAPLTGDGRRLPDIGWTWSLFCRRRDPSPDACLSSGCPRISLSIFCLLSMRAAPHHARTRASWKRAQGPGSRRPPRWGGGQHCGLCNLWMEKRFHARTSTSSSTFPSQRASVPPIQFLPHLWAPGRLFPSHPLLPLSGPPLLPPPKSRRCNRSRRTLRPPAGSPSLVPASLPASLPLSTTSAGQRRGILEYYGTAVPLFFFGSPSLWRCWRGSAAACAVGPATSVVSTSAVSIKTHTSPPFASREPRARSPISPIRLRLCVPVQFSPGHPTTSSPPPQVPAVSRHFYISMSIDPRPTTTTRLNSTARSEKGQPVFPVSPAPVIPPTILSTSLVGKETDPTNLVAAPSPGANITATPTPAHPDPRR